MSRQDEFLESQKILRLSTILPDGTPHIVPVWYIYMDKKLYVGTNTTTTKAKNIARDGRVGFCIDEGVRSPIYGVAGSGTADLISDPAEIKEIAVKILHRYMGTIDESGQEILDNTDCIIRITPTKTTEWSY